jgi:hypothetical protein
MKDFAKRIVNRATLVFMAIIFSQTGLASSNPESVSIEGNGTIGIFVVSPDQIERCTVTNSPFKNVLILPDESYQKLFNGVKEGDVQFLKLGWQLFFVQYYPEFNSLLALAFTGQVWKVISIQDFQSSDFFDENCLKDIDSKN